MKFAAWILLLFAGLAFADDTPISVDLTDPVQAALVAQLDSVRAVRLAAAAQRMADRVDSLYMDSTLTAAGVTVLADTRDSTWVQIDVPLASSSGLAAAFWGGVLQEFVADNAEVTAVGRVRTSEKKAKNGLLRLSAILMMAQ